ncbi:MAG TPA: hypothetical protein VKP65_05405, partial [Rhodothermales bacterium]|nr:hypothetical protein [Rhodothermales bacterium]
LEELTALFIRSQEEERHRLQHVLEQLLAMAELIPLSAAIISDAHAYQQQGFSPQDAVVYASVLSHLSAHEDDEKVFLNRNSKDFDDPDVQDQLEGLDCNMLFRFDDGLGYIRHRLGRQDV